MALSPFTKMHGLGNDFLVLDARPAPLNLAPAQVRRLADRHTGIGFDQLILIEPSEAADLRLRFWNSDGGEVAACGNGSRAAATLLGGHHHIETAGGMLDSQAADGGAEVDMGTARFDWQAVPLAYAMDTAALPLAWDILERPVAVSVGNPHVVFFVEDAAAVPLGALGPLIEHDPVFPERVNVGVAQVLAPDHLLLRVWERGAGATLACGTGAVASVAAAARRGLLGGLAAPHVRVSLPGGDLFVRRRDDGHLLLSGPAEIAFTGLVDLERYA